MDRNIKAVVFDLDGTLLNTIEDIADANNQMLSARGLASHSLDKYIQWIGNGAKQLVEKSLPANLDVDISECVQEYEFFYEKNSCNKSHLYSGVSELLDFLVANNIKIAINTNKPQHLTDLVQAHYLIKWPFEVVIGKSKAFLHKPDPAGALHISKQLNVDPMHMLFVGDSDVDMKTAQNAEMIPLGVTCGYGHPETVVGADCLINDASKIKDFVKQKNAI